MDLTTLHRKFNTQDKCIAYLEKLRFGKKVYCVLCGAGNITDRPGTIKWHCNSCNRDFSVLKDTIFEDSRLPLPKFFQVIVLMIQAKQGISASQISRNVGITYKTAWYACHRVRCAMINNELRLEGMVEMDETYVGGKPRKEYVKDESTANLSKVTHKRGRGTKKTPVVGVVEKKGRVYVKIVEKLTSRNLLAMLKKVVNTNESIVFTDEFRSYKSFDEVVSRIEIKHSEGYGHGVETINTIEGFWSIVKAGIKGNYKVLSKKYLPFYLAEFSYKYNQRHLQKDAFTEILTNTVNQEKCLLNYKPKCKVKDIVYKSSKCKK
jgi:transposase-like protein